MTLLKAAVASASVMRLACDYGLPLDSSCLQFAVGKWGNIATLSAAFRAGMPQSPYICAGAALGGCLAELIWLVRDHMAGQRSGVSSTRYLWCVSCCKWQCACARLPQAVWHQLHCRCSSQSCNSWAPACYRVPACRGLPFRWRGVLSSSSERSCACPAALARIGVRLGHCTAVQTGSVKRACACTAVGQAAGCCLY
jgi:hypothetical protein